MHKSNGTQIDADTAIINASRLGDVQALRTSLGCAGDLDRPHDLFGTPLAIASSRGFTECVDILLKSGASVNKLSNGQSPLNHAVEKNHYDCVHLLLESGADVNLTNRYCCSPIITCAREGYNEVATLLIQYDANVNEQSLINDMTPLMESARAGYPVCVEKFISFGANLNIQDRHYKHSALHWAVISYHENCVRLLLSAGANVKSVETFGSTPLYLAITNFPPQWPPTDNILHRFSGIVSSLLHYGSEVNISTNPYSFLKHHLYEHLHHIEYITKVMFAAGETVEGTRLNLSIPHYIRDLIIPKSQINLAFICRDFVRSHLLRITPVNLYCTTARLGLPTPLINFLMYHIALNN